MPLRLVFTTVALMVLWHPMAGARLSSTIPGCEISAECTSKASRVQGSCPECESSGGRIEPPAGKGFDALHDCIDGKCLAVCNLDGDCGVGDVCMEGFCKPCRETCSPGDEYCCDALDDKPKIRIAGQPDTSSWASLDLILIFAAFLLANCVGLVFCYSYTYYKRLRMESEV